MGGFGFPVLCPDSHNPRARVHQLSHVPLKEPLRDAQGWVRPGDDPRAVQIPRDQGDTLLPGTGPGSRGGPPARLPRGCAPCAGFGQAPHLHHAAFRLPGVGSLSCHLNPPHPTAVRPRHGCPHGSSTPRKTEEKEFQAPTHRRLSGPVVLPWWHRGSRKRYHPQTREKGVPSGRRGAAGWPKAEQLRTSGALCLPQPRPTPRCRRRCFAASLREDAAGSTGSSASTGASPLPARGCVHRGPGMGSRHGGDLSPMSQALHRAGRAAAPPEGLRGI